MQHLVSVRSAITRSCPLLTTSWRACFVRAPRERRCSKRFVSDGHFKRRPPGARNNASYCAEVEISASTVAFEHPLHAGWSRPSMATASMSCLSRCSVPVVRNSNTVLCAPPPCAHTMCRLRLRIAIIKRRWKCNFCTPSAAPRTDTGGRARPRHELAIAVPRQHAGSSQTATVSARAHGPPHASLNTRHVLVCMVCLPRAPPVRARFVCARRRCRFAISDCAISASCGSASA